MSEVLVINTDGTMKVEKLTGDPSVDWKLFQETVGGYFERVPLANYTQLMWVNEEGKIIGLPHNPLAQKLWDMEWGEGTDVVVGNVIITGEDTEEGETSPLPRGELETIMNILSN